MDLIKEIHGYLAEEITSMNKVIIDSLRVDEELIKVISNHLSTSRGKRLRPILTLLSSKMLGYNGENSIKLAAAVEFIHMATLLHDDVVDGSKMRRFLPTANIVWGNKASILVGDFLFSQSFKLIVATGVQKAMTALSNASAIIAEGEVAQLAKLEQRVLISREQYFAIIRAKTAELFGASCEVGAYISSKDELSKSLKDFGIVLGSIFQITDDLLDYFSESDNVGKNIGDDFYEGKITLPVILLNDRLSKNNQLELINIIQKDERSSNELNWLIKMLREHDISNEIKSYLDAMKKESYQLIDSINGENKAKLYLKNLVDFAINRTY